MILLTKLLVCLVFLPIAIELFKVSGKPVYLVLSDLCFILFPIVMFLGVKRTENHTFTSETITLIKIALASIAFIIAIGAIGTIRLGGDILPIVSAVRLMKNHVFFIFGAYLALNMKVEDFLIIGRRISLVFIAILVFSDVFWGSFPNPRLGGLFFNLEVYGFPNSPSVFYTIFCAFLINGVIYSKNKLFRLIYGTASVILLVYIVATLSRAGMLNVILFMSFMGLVGSKGYKTALIMLFALMFYFISYLMLNNPELLTGLESKFNKFDANQDVSNGRFEIWIHALDVFSQNPIFGLAFEPFSNYGDHATPHNQYIEMLFKVGFIGFISYFSPLIYSLIRVQKFAKKIIDNNLCEISRVTIGLTISILITNNVQPNLSYTPTGVFIYFLLGFTLCKITQNNLR
jgi:O-antigen ligase